MSDTIVVALISVSGTLLTLILKPVIINFFSKKNKDPLKEAIEINNLITSKLEEIKNKYKIDRLYLCQFHNGGNFYPTGKSIQKFTMVYELSNSSINSIQHQFQGIPTGLFSKSINYLETGDFIKINDFKDCDTFGLDMLYESGSKSSYIFPMLTINNRFIGFIGVDFAKKTVIEQEKINELKLEVNTIGGVLMNKYLNKK